MNKVKGFKKLKIVLNVLFITICSIFMQRSEVVANENNIKNKESHGDNDIDDSTANDLNLDNIRFSKFKSKKQTFSQQFNKEMEKEIIEFLKAEQKRKAKEQKIEEEKRKAEEEQKKKEYVEWEKTHLKNISIPNNSSVKSWMNGRLITAKNSKQYKLMHSKKVYTNSEGHFAMNYKGKEYIGVALSSYWGNIGDKFKVTLSSGEVMYVFMLDQKKGHELIDGVAHPDGSVIEMVVDKQPAQSYYGKIPWNFNSVEKFNGKIVKFQKVVDK